MNVPKICPCGCGRKLGWGPHKKGAAVGYVEISELLAFVTPMVEDSLRLDNPTPQNRSETERFLANGAQLKRWLLEHVHGTATPGRTPDLRQLSSGLQAFEQDTARILASATENGWVVDDGRGNPRYTGRSAVPGAPPDVREPQQSDGYSSSSMVEGASIVFVGPCYQCRTATPPKLSNAVVTTPLPRSGVVTVCMLCDGCLADSRASMWDGWMRQGSPPPNSVAGRLLVQTVGVCFTCLKPMASVTDLTGISGQRMAPATCSADCEIEARRQLG